MSKKKKPGRKPRRRISDAPATTISVYEEELCLGHAHLLDGGGWIAIDAHGHRLGTFANQVEACRALGAHYAKLMGRPRKAT